MKYQSDVGAAKDSVIFDFFVWQWLHLGVGVGLLSLVFCKRVSLLRHIVVVVVALDGEGAFLLILGQLKKFFLACRIYLWDVCSAL